MALAGNVETIGLSSIFLFISTNSLSGLFRVTSDNGELVFCFDNGDIFFPEEARRTTYTLGGMLSSTKRISKDLLAEVRDEERLEEVLVERGEATRAELEAAKRMQYEEEIYDLFLWQRAFFEFKPGGEPEPMKAALEAGRGFTFHTASILMEAARRADDLSRIRHMIPSHKAILQVEDGQDGEVNDRLKEARIEGSSKSFDGKATIQQVLQDWKVPYTQALATIATLVETEALSALPTAEAIQRFRDALDLGLVPQATSILSFLLDTEPEGPNRRSVGLEAELLSASGYQDYRAESSFEAKVPGARVFRLLKLCLDKRRPFTLIVRQDEHEKRIARTHHQLAVSSTKRAATPKLIHFLQRTGAVTEAEAKRLWTVSGKQLFNELLGSGKVTRAQWLESLAEKVAEELVELFFWDEPQVEVINRAQSVTPAPRPMKISLPLEDNVEKALLDRLSEFAELVKVVPSEQAIFCRRHESLPPPHPFYKRFDGERPLFDVRRNARAGPIEFFRFVYNGVKKRILRPVTLDELVRGMEQALETGDHRKAQHHANAIRAFELENLVPEQLARVESETQGLVLDTHQYRLEGDLVHFSLAEVLQTLTQENLSGTLLLRSEQKDEMTLLFYRGQGFWIERESEDDEDFLDLFSGEGSDLDEALAESFEGTFDDFADQAREAQLAELKEKILNVFFWDRARFEFTRNLLPEAFWESGRDDSVSKISLDTQSFLLEVLNKLRILDDIRREIPSEATLVEFVSTEAKMAAIGQGVFAEVVMIIDGRHSVQQLASACSGSRFELYQFLHELIGGGLIRVVKPTDFAKAWEDGR